MGGRGDEVKVRKVLAARLSPPSFPLAWPKRVKNATICGQHHHLRDEDCRPVTYRVASCIQGKNLLLAEGISFQQGLDTR